MKRTLSLILAIAMIITLLPTIAIAESETAEAGYTLTYDLTTNALSARVPRNGTETTSLSKDVVASDGTARQMHMFDWNYKSSEVAEGDTGEVPYATLDLAKTAPYKIENRASRLIGTSYTEYISDKGLYADYNIKSYANEGNKRPHVFVRLKIDKPGVYKFSLKNSEMEVWNPFAEVWFGKAGEEYLPSQVDSILASGNYEPLGWWCESSVIAGYFDHEDPVGKQFDAFTVNVPEAGEYWVILNFPEKITSFNGASKTYLGENYQYLRLSEMKLVATGEDPKEEEITGPVNKFYEFNKYVTSGTKPILTEYTYEKDGWEINKNGTCQYLTQTTGSGFWGTSNAGMYPLGIYAYLRPTPLTYRVMALDFAIDKDGHYDVSMLTTALDEPNGGWASVYIDGKYVGQINGVKGRAGDTKLRPLSLKAGKHTLFVAADRALGTTHARMAIGNLKFTGTEEASTLTNATLVLSDTEGVPGGTIDASASLKFSNNVTIPAFTESYMDDLTLSSTSYNSYKTAEGESITLTSSNSEVATVSGTKITLLEAGTADITFTATLDGVTKSVTKKVMVKEENPDLPRPANYKLTYQTNVTAMSKRLPVLNTTSVTAEGLRTSTILCNPDLMNWKRTTTAVADGDTGEVPYKTLDLSKTDAFALMHSNNVLVGANSTNITTPTMNVMEKVELYGKTSAERPHIAFRLVVPYGGAYELTFSDPEAFEQSKPFAAIYFGEAPATYVPADVDGLLKEYNFLGWWSSNEGYFDNTVTADAKDSHKLDKFVVNVPAAGEYFLILDFNSKSFELNSKTYSDGGKYQYFRLASISLTGIDEELPRPENYVLAYKTDVSVMSTRLPLLGTGKAKDEGLRDAKTLDNISLVNWKKQVTAVKEGDTGEVPYYSLDTSKTAPYAIEAIEYSNCYKPAGAYAINIAVDGIDSTIKSATIEAGGDSATRPNYVFRLQIPYSGAYKLEITPDGGKEKYRPYTKLWFGKASETYDAAKIDELIKGYDCVGWWSANDGYFSKDLTPSTKDTSAVDELTVNVPEAGEYYLIFDILPESIELNDNHLVGSGIEYQRFRLKAFTLTGIEADGGGDEGGEEEEKVVPASIESDIAKRVYIGDSVTVNAKIKMSDGTYATFGGENTAAVTGDNFATVSDVATNGDTVTFKVTGANAGDAKITVSGKVNGKDFSYALDLTVKAAELPRPDNFSISYETTIEALSDKVPALDTKNRTDEGTYKGQTLYNYTYLDWKRVAKDENGEEYNTLDLEKTGAYKLELLSNGLPAGTTNGNSEVRGARFVTPTASYVNKSGTRPHLVFRLVVPYAGTYEISMIDGQKTTYEPYVKVYFGEAPKTYNADAVDSLEKEYEFLGWWYGDDGVNATAGSHYAPELTDIKEINADAIAEQRISNFTVNVPASGEYFLILDTDKLSNQFNTGCLAADGKNQYLGIKTITLKGVAGPSVQNVETDLKEVLALDKEYTINAKIKLADRKYANLDSDCVISVSGSENLTVSDVATNGENLTFKVRATNVSDAEKLTISGTIGESEFSIEKKVIVAANEVVTTTYQFSGLISSGQKAIMKDFTYDNDGWEINKDGTCTYLKDTFWKDTTGLYPLGIYGYIRPTPVTYRVMAIDFKVEQDGYYDISALVNYVTTSGGLASAYIDGKYVGQISSMKDTAGDLKLRPLELKEGRHTFFIAGDKIGDVSPYSYIFLGNIKLSGTPEKAELSDVTMTLPAGKYFAGTSIVANTTLKFDNNVETVGITESYIDDLVLSSYNYNSFKTAEGESMVITSSDESVAKVEGKTIKLLSDGEVDITFTAVLDGVTKSVTKTIEVEKAILSSIKLKGEKGYILLDDADGTAITVTGKLSDGNDADLTNAEVYLESSNPSVAAIENGRVIPKSVGDVTISVTVVLDGEEVTETIDFVVSEEPIAASVEIMFKDKTSQATSKGGYFTADTHGDTWTINKTLTNEKYYNGSTSTAVRIQDSVQYGYLYNHGDFAFDFVTDEDGYYDVELEMIPDTSTSGNVQFYVDGIFLGYIDAKAPVRDLYTPTVKLGRPVALKAGTHTLIVRKPGNAFVNGVRFIGTSVATGFKGIEIGVARNEFAPGESEDYTMKLVWANGAALDVPITNLDGSLDAEFEVTSSDSSIISVSGTTFKALKTGVANLQTEAEFDGSNVSGITQIIVNDAVYDHAELNLDEELLYFEGGKKALETTVVLSNGKTTDKRNVSNVRYTSSDESLAKVENGTLNCIKEGKVTITAYATFNGVEKSVSKTINIEKVKIVGIRAESAKNILSALDTEGSNVVVYGINNNGSEVDLGSIPKTVTSLTPDLISVDEEGKLHYVARGTGKIHVAATVNGSEFECDAEVVSSSQKTAPTIYTYEMREQAVKNASKYDWAKSLKNSAVNTAQKYLDHLEKYYDLIPAEGIPRSYTITTLQSPADMTYICPYCKSDIRALHGAYSWVINPINNPWKIACPECKRLFPSNDFENFYKLGLRGDGTFDRALAYQKNQELVDSGHPGYLVNELYPKISEELGIPADKAATWMVDDGFGWSPKTGTYGGSEPVTTDPKWAPIAYYTHVFWDRNGVTYSVITRAIKDLTQAYLYSGEAKYGRAGAILLDRIADVYDDYDITKISLSYSHSHGGDYSGKTVGSIWETNVADAFAQGYDAFYPMMDDPQVIDFLSKKAVQYGNPNPKLTGDMIRENAENGILRSIIDGVKTAKINGNFGMHQYSMALAAVALDTYPETDDAFKWMALPGGETKKSVTDPIYGTKYNSSYKNNGGEMLTRYINEVCRDGFGNEVGIGYNTIWINNGIEIAELLHRYGAKTDINLLENPKYLKMFNSFIKQNVGAGYALSIGDSGGTASTGRTSIESHTLRAFNLLGDPQYAKNYYWAVGGDLEDIYIDIFTDNEGLAKNIQKIIDEQGEYEFESEMLTGYGLSILRYGALIPGTSGGSDYRGDAWMYHGRIGGHGHNDGLQLGINAYGFNFGPDLGYPEATGYDPNRLQWCSQTISHNTVVVDGESQIGTVGGNPMHFDSADKVQVMDVDLSSAYNATDVYRRTVVSVEASSDVNYTVDFFRIIGGNEHMYSFHTQSYNGYTTDDLTLVPQVDEDGNFVGTYAGRDVPYGPDPNTILTSGSYKLQYTRGYTWLENVNRATPESGNFSVNFKQTDFRKSVKDSSGLNLKYTALNDWTPSQVGFATGHAPNTASNKMIPGLDYMLIHRKGKNLDTLFTSVLQPYNGEEYIESMESVPLEIKDGRQTKADAAKAVKVVLKNGRTDYVVYATNNSVLYTVDGKFDFRGVIGVYSIGETGENIYAYVHDGDIIGDTTGTAALKGTVVDFTEALSSENSITVALDKEYDFDVEELTKKYIYVDNDHSNLNGAYRILDAEMVGDNLVLDIGDVSLVKNYINNANPSAGYVFNVARGQSFSIPLSSELNDAPVVVNPGDSISTSAGSTTTIKISAESTMDGAEVTFVGSTLPRGASIDPESGLITWKPTASQLGENGFVITVRDGDGRESSISFIVNVYGSTSGGGGGSSASSKPTTPNIPDDKEDEKKEDEPTTPSTPATPGTSGDNENVRFTDLGNHAWAADAINALADDGIIKGTSEDEFSPAAKITRGMLVTVLYRMEGEPATNRSIPFSDVDLGAYYGNAVIWAKQNGIVNGVTENEFAPDANLTREQFAAIIHRYASFKEYDVSVGENTNILSYNDAESISEYAIGAIQYTVSSGLIKGKTESTLNPKDTATRAEMAVIIKRFLDLTAEEK